MTHTARRVVLGAAAVGLLTGTVGATAAPLPVPALAIAPPQAAVVGFALPTVIALKGQNVSFLNADVVGHTVTSVATKPKRVKYGKKYYTIRVPLFDSGGVSSATLGEVKGVTTLKPGSYAFYCALHTGMKGTLVVESAG
ncbi:MAG TPA: plastocyanin/azurin family copper-binding protein [Mycobacteriales bacterium]|nr:plastocyanin/azurin family copper-binding protein [Mycobacteriales bacterium]